MPTAVDKLKDWIRPLAARLAAGRRVQVFVHRTTYLGRFHEWTRAHPCPELPQRRELYDHVLRNEVRADPISYLEFGVFRGDSIRWWAQHCSSPASTFVGFDSFEGLPEEWGSMPPGTFSTSGAIPEIDDARVRFVKGWFSATVPQFFATRPATGRIVAHLDADLYSSSLLVLMCLAPHLRAGDILIFDEFSDYMDEFRALESTLQAHPFSFTALGHTPTWTQVALRVD